MISKRRSFIVGIKGIKLSPKEITFLKKYRPWGIILFERNIYNINQTKIDWLLDRSNLQKSRGGTTRGKPAILDPVPSKYFNKLQKSKN